jgi:glycerophosphoryl diester phosphodiesterase
MGADAVELDVRRTRDGDLVVHHDPHLADGRAISAVNRADLPDYLPGLDDALDACGEMWVNVEIKNDPDEPDFDPTDGIAAVVAEALKGRRSPDRFLVSSFRRETIDTFRRTAPAIATAFLTAAPNLSTDIALLDDLRAAGHRAIHPWYGLVTAAFVSASHERGIAVNVWTCDDPDTMRTLAAWGVDGICTNVPDVALEVLGRA